MPPPRRKKARGVSQPLKPAGPGTSKIVKNRDSNLNKTAVIEALTSKHPSNMGNSDENSQAENIEIDSDSELSSAPDDETMLDDTSSYPSIELTPTIQQS